MSNELQQVDPKPLALSVSPHGAAAQRDIPLSRDLRGTILLSTFVVMMFFVLGGGWAATAPLGGAVIASGKISPIGSRQTVQHLEGGIIRAIRVKEGDNVVKGQALVILEDIAAQAEVGALSNRLAMLAARESRLDAERTGNREIRFVHPALADANDPEVRAFIEQEMNQWRTRRANDESRKAILGQRVAQLQQQIAGLERQLIGIRRQKSLIREELVVVQEMFEKGYERKPRLLSLQRQEADLIGREGDMVSRIGRVREAIGETQLQVINLKIERMEEVDAELADTQARRSELEEQIKNSLDRLSRTVIVSPTTGIVFDLKFTTPGGVIRPGEKIMDVVPVDEELIVDARVAITDIDNVRPGLSAYVLFPSYPQRNLARISAAVSTVSADTMQDDKTGEQFFSTTIRVDREQLEEIAPEIKLTPGLPAEVYISVSERTLLEFLIQPFLQTIERTFREP